ncbi:MAG TPA: G8 domain-containing protein, partial [Longimicrobiaceae bacterium]
MTPSVLLRRVLPPFVLLFALAACAGDATGPRGEGAPPPPTNRWSDPASWPEGVVPQAGAAVVIPRDRALLLDVSPPPLRSLQIEGSLVFDDRDLALTADWVMVHGTLRIGSERTPYRHRATITLTGSDPAQEVMGMGTKVLGVMGGTLEVHGEPRTPWLRLAATAAKGATQLVLERAPDWRPGDRLAVASTDYDPAQAEEVTVRSVSGKTVTLEQPLRFAHWGTMQSYAGRPLDERAEVGLLTRNVTVRGDDGSAVTGFGGHLMIMPGSTAHVEGVELFLMGQKGKVARYPFHWHMAGSVEGSYLRGSSVWRSFNRCVTVHGSHRAAVEDNVCYDHLGHGYFLEDGVETGNLFSGNLGLRSRAPAASEAVLPSDTRPATFWITNPANAYRGNVAAGSQGFGFWYALPEHPTGFSTDASVWPRRTPLGEFSGNVAHSNRSAALNVDDGPRPDGTTETTSYRPRQTPGAESPAVVAEFRDFTGYKNSGRAVWLRGSSQLLTGAMLADNAIGATFAASETFFRDGVVVGESENRTAPPNAAFPIRGFEFYDGRVGAERVTFVNFRPTAQRQASALGFNRANGFPVSTGNYAGAIRLVDANAVFLETPRADKDGDRAAVFLDEDGSLTGTAGAFVAANAPLLVTPACTLRSEWNAYACRSRFVDLRVASSGTEAVAPLEIRRDDGVAASMVGVPGNPKSVAMSVVPGRAYALRPPAAASKPRVSLARLAAGEWVRVSLP